MVWAWHRPGPRLGRRQSSGRRRPAPATTTRLNPMTRFNVAPDGSRRTSGSAARPCQAWALSDPSAPVPATAWPSHSTTRRDRRSSTGRCSNHGWSAPGTGSGQWATGAWPRQLATPPPAGCYRPAGPPLRAAGPVGSIGWSCESIRSSSTTMPSAAYRGRARIWSVPMIHAPHGRTAAVGPGEVAVPTGRGSRSQRRASKNPNVFYELGLAQALEKPVVLVSANRDDVQRCADLHFCSL